MSSAIYVCARSHPLSKLLSFNSTSPMFQTPQVPREMKPGTLTDSGVVTVGSQEADIKVLGDGGSQAPSWIFLQPYVEGAPGTQFWLNIWGYSDAGFENTRQSVLWVPFFICQLWGAAGNIPGLSETALLNQAENLCDMIGLTLGTLGTGFINSVGSDCAAYAKIDMMGAKRFLVEFASDPAGTGTPTSPVPGMNALWRPL